MKTAAPERMRLKVCVRGAVQGVGFRPFIFRLATELGLVGWVNNTAQGVFLEVEGPRAELESFLLRLETEKPPRSFIQSLESSWLDPVDYAGFDIRDSASDGVRTTLVLPDIATCPDCLREISDPDNRRYFYPFTNCTHCGPRFSIIEALPYDRANTSMKAFALCEQCRAEYDDPRDRRFHAQPNACPKCGPRLDLWDPQGKSLDDSRHSAISGEQPHEYNRRLLQRTADAIRDGKIVAVKGLGGFHLMVDARNDRAVRRLRELKHREEKPFAVMFPSLDSVKAACEMSPLEERLILSPESPIVLLKQTSDRLGEIAASVAPGNPNLGALLPYTPLHHLLLSLLGFPVVATSGNLSDEPICIDEREALDRLGGIADLFLVHNRPIVRHVDDSIARVMLDREMILRRARGYAPLPIEGSGGRCQVSGVGCQVSGEEAAFGAEHGLRTTENTSRITTHNSQLTNHSAVLALGAHLKNTVALSVGSQVFISQHIGDLETTQAFDAFRRVIADLQKLYEIEPATIVCDAHPDYLSTKFARELAAQPLPGNGDVGPPRCISVQHHEAHVWSCMAENQLEPPVCGVAWDGTGYGLDGTVWGGEFFAVSETGCERVACLRRFRLPGGDRAVKEPRRTALGLLYELLGNEAFNLTAVPTLREIWHNELATFQAMLERGIQSPLTSSAGRLFDAVASIIGLRQRTRFEGQAAMELEFLAMDAPAGCESYAFTVGSDPDAGLLILDWGPMIRGILSDAAKGRPRAEIAAEFHHTLADMIVSVAQRIGHERVVLSGGCFQNRYLLERAVHRLREENFRPCWHQRVPPNDGGIALGQAAAALRQIQGPVVCA